MGFRQPASAAALALLLTIPAQAGAPPRPSQVVPATEADRALLPGLLAKTAEYCGKVHGLALYFVCRVRLSMTGYRHEQHRINIASNVADALTGAVRLKPKGSRNLRRTYDYQLVNKDGALTERYTLIERGGRAVKPPVAGDPEGVRFVAKYLVFGPGGFLSREWRPEFDVSVLGREAVDGRDALIVRCVPLHPGGENDNEGRIWIAPDDGAILQIEWEPRRIPGFDPADAPTGLVRGLAWRVTYGVEKNGVRFPSRQAAREFVTDERGVVTVMEEADFEYVDYKFFTVGVDVDVRKVS